MSSMLYSSKPLIVLLSLQSILKGTTSASHAACPSHYNPRQEVNSSLFLVCRALPQTILVEFHLLCSHVPDFVHSASCIAPSPTRALAGVNKLAAHDTGHVRFIGGFSRLLSRVRLEVGSVVPGLESRDCFRCVAQSEDAQSSCSACEHVEAMVTTTLVPIVVTI